MSSRLEQLSAAGWDRTFLNLSSKMADPFCDAFHALRYRLLAPLDPKEFENCDTKTKEIATRSLIVLGSAFGGFLLCTIPVPMLCTVTALGIGSRGFRVLGFAIQQNGFTHVRSKTPEKDIDLNNLKVSTWNICAIGGGMSLNHGGVIYWRSRIDGIIAKIEAEDPDVLILQELFDTGCVEALIQKLQAKYAHFYIHMGPNNWGQVSGRMVITKCAVDNFTNESFTTNNWMMNRGFSVLELKQSPHDDEEPCIRLIDTHLDSDNEPQDIKNRQVQIAHIVRFVANRHLSMTTVIGGDLNIDRDHEGSQLPSLLAHSYLGAEPTCTGRLTQKWDGRERKITDLNETVDYLSLIKSTLPDGTPIPTVAAGAKFVDCKLVEVFDNTFNTKTALSDHRCLSVVLMGLTTATPISPLDKEQIEQVVQAAKKGLFPADQSQVA